MPSSTRAPSTIPVTLRSAPLAIPALLSLPENATVDSPAPAALLLHGFNGHKEKITSILGKAFIRAGIATLAIDLPLHGDRGENWDLAHGLQLLSLWQNALEECDAAIRYLHQQPALDRTRIGIAGYSVGGLLALGVTAHQPSVRALAMLASGDLPSRSPVATALRIVLDPIRAVRHVAGVPLLMVNGRHDRIFQRGEVERLFDAAPEPKELRWLATGHRLVGEAARVAADWMSSRLEESAEAAASRPRVDDMPHAADRDLPPDSVHLDPR